MLDRLIRLNSFLVGDRNVILLCIRLNLFLNYIYGKHKNGLSQQAIELGHRPQNIFWATFSSFITNGGATIYEIQENDRAFMVVMQMPVRMQHGEIANIK